MLAWLRVCSTLVVQSSAFIPKTQSLHNAVNSEHDEVERSFVAAVYNACRQRNPAGILLL